MGILSKADTATVELVKQVQRQTNQLADLELDANRLDRELREAKAEAGKAALDLENGKVTRKEYDALARKVGDLEAERSQKLFAAARARQELSDAKQALFEAKASDRRHEAENFAAQRKRHVAEIVDAIAAFWKARQALHNVNEKIGQAFGSSILLQHMGTLLSADEMQRAIEVELARVSSRGPLAGNVCPALPGSKQYILGGNSAKAMPLVEVIEQANGALVKRAVTGYVGDPQPKPQAKPAPAPTANDPDDAFLQGPPVGPTVSADQIQATLGRRKMA